MREKEPSWPILYCFSILIIDTYDRWSQFQSIWRSRRPISYRSATNKRGEKKELCWPFTYYCFLFVTDTHYIPSVLQSNRKPRNAISCYCLTNEHGRKERTSLIYCLLLFIICHRHLPHSTSDSIKSELQERNKCVWPYKQIGLEKRTSWSIFYSCVLFATGTHYTPPQLQWNRRPRSTISCGGLTSKYGESENISLIYLLLLFFIFHRQLRHSTSPTIELEIKE